MGLTDGPSAPVKMPFDAGLVRPRSGGAPRSCGRTTDKQSV